MGVHRPISGEPSFAERTPVTQPAETPVGISPGKMFWLKHRRRHRAAQIQPVGYSDEVVVAVPDDPLPEDAEEAGKYG